MTLTAPERRTATRTADAVPALVAGSLLGGALVHSLVVREHLAEWRPAGLFFVVLVLLETLLAALVVHRWTRAVVLLVLVSNLGTVTVWVLSRTTGLPVGPEAWAPEAVGVPDVACCLLELVGALLCAVALRSHAGLRLSRVTAVAATVAVLALTTGGIAASAGTGATHAHQPSSVGRH